ncbi:phage major capsid protein [Ralstonia sp.]|uniref:phage major capsid protein n=1 Tax=Ralstonia sp. TaxID=54061 RepID=UPI00257E3200|nr:phage major capsid protein [Ralstonia sp.]
MALAFASETPYERYWGVEVLEITTRAVNVQRLRSGANLLVNHSADDVVGVVEAVEIGEDKVARAVVRFGRSARAEEVWQDVRDGIRRSVSVGYMIHKAILIETKDGLETYRVTDWEPYEISLVSVPADATVGVGRSASEPSRNPAPTHIEVKMSDTNTPQAERNHAAEISKIAATLPGGGDMAMSAIQRGLTVEAFQREAIEKLASKPVPTADVGMDKKEVRQYSLMRAINALANPTDQAAQRAAAFERECSDAVAAKLGKQARGLLVPIEVQKRTLMAGTPSAAGNLIATDLLTGSYIDLLRNAMVLPGMGTRFLTGLVGNIAIPRLSGSATTHWVAENVAPAESNQSVLQVTMSPRTLGAWSEISRKLLLQSSLDVEAMVQGDLAQVMGLAIQQAAINGTSAAGQPSGLLTRITPSVIGGVNGLAPNWQHMIDLETNVATANADVGAMGYLTNARVRGRLKSTSKVTGQNGFIWENGTTPVNGYSAAVTNAVPSNLTRGTGTNLSAIIFGNFSDLVIGMWGTLDLTVDPYSSSTTGAVRLIALQEVDVAVRYVESFATMVDAIA